MFCLSKILACVQTMTAGQTRLMITHKLIEAQSADKIIVLQNGRVADEGTHEELLKRDGLYKQLWETQASSDQVDAVKNEDASRLKMST